MRVLFDIAAAAGGGAERQLAQVSAGLVERGHSVHVVVHKRMTAYSELFQQAGVTVCELHTKREEVLRILTRLRRQLLSFRPDVVVCVNFNATLWGRLVAALLDIPCVCAEHSSDRVRLRKIWLTNRILSHWTDAIIACADAQKSTLVKEGHRSAKITVIPNGVDAQAFYFDETEGEALRRRSHIVPSDFVVGLIAAHRAEKRHDRFIAMIEELRRRRVPAIGLMVGDGPLMDDNVALCRKSDCADAFRILGRVEHMRAVYNACDVVVLVSDSVETFPLSFLEAQACGTPVAAMRVGGVEETMAQDDDKLLVPQGDIAAMSRILVDLASVPAKRASIGIRGREHVACSFSLCSMVTEYETLLAETIHRSRKRNASRRR